ncbi:MAG: hypothetical protein ABEH65_11315 [Halobacteriales archaeon]
MKRRELLRGTGLILTTAGLAGCTGAGGGGDGTATETASPSPSPEPSGTPTQTPTPTATEPAPPSGDWQTTEIDGGTVRHRVANRECGQGTDAATVIFEDDRVRIDGTLSGSDTCATATLADVELADGALTLTIESTRVDTTGTPACGQCIVDIDYRTHFVPDNGLPQSVTVVHTGTNGTVTVAEESR